MSEKIFKYRDDGFRIGGISRHKNTVNGSFLLHTHDYYEFELAVSGSGKNYINGVEYPVSRGSIWALGPDDSHKIEGDGLTVCHISLYLPEISAELLQISSSLEFPLYGSVGDKIEILESLFSVFLGYSYDEFLCAKKLSAVACAILFEFVSHLKHAETPSGKTSEYVRRAIRYIHDHAEELISLSHVAKSLHIAPAYLSAIFPEYAGCGFNEYLTRTRLGRAKAMLRNTDRTVTEIAGMCGFGCVSAMNRAFRKYFDTSPTCERKEKG